MIINLHIRTASALFVMGAMSFLGLLTLPMQAQQDPRAERLRLQNEESRLNKKVTELEGHLRDLKRFERHVIGLTDPDIILISVAADSSDIGIRVKFPANEKWVRSLGGVPFPISTAQLDELANAMAMEALLFGREDPILLENQQKLIDRIKNDLLLHSRYIQRILVDTALVSINKETAEVLQDINSYTADRERVRADFARLTGQAGAAEEGRTYDDKGKTVYVPCGEQAFADEFVGRTAGSPAPKGPSGTDPEGALKRDYNAAKDTGYYSLGCRGSIMLSFSQVYLVDGPGPDLYVFEIGPDVEGTKLEIKTESGAWIPVGEIGGGAVQVDIHAALASRGMLNQRFTQVKLTDLGQKCAGNWPGADIDAVAALNCVLR
jgi:hypothetical protein